MSKEIINLNVNKNELDELLIRLAEQKQKIKKDKGSLLDAAKVFNEKNKAEVDEGTKKLQLLLEDGRRKGIPDIEVLNQLSFFPTVRTPLLNLLYFLTKEYGSHENVSPDMITEQNKKYGSQWHPEDDTAKKLPDVSEFIYGNVTFDMFDKIKKLKALSQSPNIEEAASAFKKCRELCKLHNLDYEKIPSLKS